MKRSGLTRGDLARALAERSRTTGKRLTEGQAQDELDRVVHGIVTSLREGRSAEMPGIGTITARTPEQKKRGTSHKISENKNPAAITYTGNPKS